MGADRRYRMSGRRTGIGRRRSRTRGPRQRTRHRRGRTCRRRMRARKHERMSGLRTGTRHRRGRMLRIRTGNATRSRRGRTASRCSRARGRSARMRRRRAPRRALPTRVPRRDPTARRQAGARAVVIARGRPRRADSDANGDSSRARRRLCWPTGSSERFKSLRNSRGVIAAVEERAHRLVAETASVFSSRQATNAILSPVAIPCAATISRTRLLEMGLPKYQGESRCHFSTSAL